ncbi:MAG: hypothetical protein KU37_09285 [Sulfuricurvum sp. PC08-66]|nr:MAG: hypothetical protein KU37_09285 [Sulfuricurvum sp. PC08-66]
MQFEAYPFEKLNRLLADVIVDKGLNPISLTIGEPQFETPDFIQNSLKEHSALLRRYPASRGEDFLVDAQLGFVRRRFGVTLDATQIIPTFGTREVLFNFPQFLLFDRPHPVMAYTNPFYQIYEGAAIASRAKVWHIDLLPENDFRPRIDEAKLVDTDLVILNFPNNPTAATMALEELGRWVEWALKYDFVLMNDECYSEIYLDTPPPSLLEASIAVGNPSFKNVVVINSISKRSSAPGLRSGFIAGDATILKSYAQYRTYVGCASPLPLQHAAADAWSNERHVQKAREYYRQNFALAQEILGVAPAQATFYLWIAVGDDEAFARFLYRTQNVKVLPGRYLGRNGLGEGYIRIALVEEPSITERALVRLKTVLEAFAQEPQA